MLCLNVIVFSTLLSKMYQTGSLDYETTKILGLISRAVKKI